MPRWRSLNPRALLTALLLLAPSRALAGDAGRILSENCIACHNPAKHRGDLVLATRDEALKGGKHGPALAPGKSAQSRLIELLAPGADPHMPPKGQLTGAEIDALRDWIDSGAPWDEALTAAAGTHDVKLRDLPASNQPVLALALSPDRKRLAAGRGDRVLVFDVTAPERPVVKELSTPREIVSSLAWSPEGKWLAVGGYQTVRVWDTQWTAPPVQLTGLSGSVNAVAFAPGDIVIAGDGEASGEGTIRQWHLPDAAPLQSWVAHADSVLALAPSKDGKLLVSGGGDKLVKVWDREKHIALMTLEGHAAQVTAVALNPDGTKLASGGADREVKVWDLKTREKLGSYPAQPAGVGALTWTEAGKFLAAFEDGALRLGSVADYDRYERTFAAGGDVLSALATDGKSAYAGGHDGQVYAWRMDSGTQSKIGPSPAPAPAAGTVSFTNDVLPVLSKAGCNAGACHAKPAGQNGFKLSVFAYDPRSDHRAIVKAVRGRRVFPAAPEESLFLRKPTLSVEHEGGLRLRKDSDDYRLLLRWLEQGMPFASDGEPTLVAVEVSPRTGRYAKKATQPLSVTARYSDGSARDVTRLADFSSGDKALATVDERGSVAVGETSGEAVVVARYMGMVDVARVTIPADDLLPDAFYAALTANNFIDRLVYDRLKALGLSPSELCTDSEFIRRSSLDAIGALPTAEQARSFLADTDPAKRDKWIDRLLDDPRYADHWANKWADLLRPNPFRAGVKSVYVLDQWLRESFRRNKPYDRFAREILTARGSTHRDGPVVIFRDRREPADVTTLVSQVFLGVRMECARCHHHPNEKWSQEDFYQLAAYFGPLKRKGQGISAPISGLPEYIWFAPGGGEVKHPVTDKAMKPKAPDAPAEQLPPDRDPRVALAAWMTRPDNPFFARAAVNRVWAELMGRGIVDPVDDFRASNPPTNPALLDALAADFVGHGFDLKHLVRTVLRSRTYQLSSAPNARNVADTRNFSRWYRRRPAGEVLLDAVSDLTGMPEHLQGAPPDGRAAAGAWNYRIESAFLDAFSRPNASADPPCERDRGGSVVQALHLMNNRKLTEKIHGGRAAALADSKLDPAEIVDELYFAAYSRPPAPDELAAAVAAFAEPGATRESATEDVMWALVNSAEFVFNH